MYRVYYIKFLFMSAQQTNSQQQQQKQLTHHSQIKPNIINHTLTHTHTHQQITQKQNPLTSRNQSHNNTQQKNKNMYITQQNQQQTKAINYYFKDMIKRHSNKNAQTMNQFTKYAICMGIQTGQVYLSQQQQSLDRIILQNKIKQQRNNKVEQQDQQQKRKRMIEIQLKYLNKQIAIGKKKSQLPQSQQNNQFIGIDQNNLVFTKKQHQQFINKIIKQRSELSLRKKSIQQKQKIKSQQQEKLKKLSQEQQAKKQKQEKKKKIMQKLQEQKKIYQIKIKEQEEHNRRLSQLKNKKFLHQKLEEKYNTEVLIPSLEEKKKKLKQIREMSKAFNIQDINNHEKQYIKKRQQILSTSQTKRLKQQWQYKAPQKSHKLAKLLQQESLQAKLKLQQKKRKLQEKIQRQQEFAIYLKQRYPPSIDPKKRQEIQQRMRLKSQIKEKQKPDRKTLGINYLEQVKNQRKKSANSQMQFERKPLIMQQTQIQTKKSQTNYLKTRRTKQQYEQIREKRIEKLINSADTDKNQKIMKLHIQASKLIQQQKRKQQKNKILRSIKSGKKNQQEDMQQTNLLLASIKAKMGIIDLYNKQ